MNYYYPAITSSITDIPVDGYGVINNTLYFNSGENIAIIAKDNFLFYDLSTPSKGLMKVSCGKAEPYCCNKILFDVVNSNWVMFKTTTNNRCCPTACQTLIDKVVCPCSESEVLEITGNLNITQPRQYTGFPAAGPYIGYVNNIPNVFNDAAFTSFTGNYNFIRNVGGVAVSNANMTSSTGIEYLTLEGNPLSGIVNNSIPLEPNKLYKIQVDGAPLAKVTANVATYNLAKSFVPIYELYFYTDASSNIINDPQLLTEFRLPNLVNNQAIFQTSINTTNPTIPFTTSATATATALPYTLMVFVDQPSAGYARMAAISLGTGFASDGTTLGSIKGSFTFKVIKTSL